MDALQFSAQDRRMTRVRPMRGLDNLTCRASNPARATNFSRERYSDKPLIPATGETLN